MEMNSNASSQTDFGEVVRHLIAARRATTKGQSAMGYLFQCHVGIAAARANKLTYIKIAEILQAQGLNVRPADVSKYCRQYLGERRRRRRVLARPKFQTHLPAAKESAPQDPHVPQNICAIVANGTKLATSSIERIEVVQATKQADRRAARFEFDAERPLNLLRATSNPHEHAKKGPSDDGS